MALLAVNGISKPLRGVSANCQWPLFGSTRTKVAARQVLPWNARKDILATKLAVAKPDLLMLQELGEAEASDLFDALGDVWHYQRYGPLNVVGWRADRLDYVKTVEVDLPDYGQWPGRGYVEAWLQDKAGNRLRIGSTHLTVKAGGDSTKQQAQIQKVVSSVNDEDDDWPLVVGIDTNNKQNGVTGGMWRVLRKYGWKWDRQGIDAVLWNFRASVANVRRLDLGNGSDHDGLVFDIATDKR